MISDDGEVGKDESQIDEKWREEKEEGSELKESVDKE